MTMIAGFKSPGDILAFRQTLKNGKRTMDLIFTVDGAEDGYEGQGGTRDKVHT